MKTKINSPDKRIGRSPPPQVVQRLPQRQPSLPYFGMELMSGGKIFDHIIEKVCPTAPALPPAKASIVCCMLDGNNRRRKLEADEQNQAPSV